MANWDISLTSSRSTTAPGRTVIVKSAQVRLPESFRVVGRHSTAHDVSGDWLKGIGDIRQMELWCWESGIRSVSLSSEKIPKSLKI